MDDREKLMERYDDAAFALMMDEYAEAEGEAILAEFRAAAEAGELPEMPEELDKACRNTIRREYARRERRVRLRQLRRAAARVAVAVFAVIGILGTLVMSVEAWRGRIIDAIIVEHEKGTSYYFDETSPPETVDDGTKFVYASHDLFIAYLPEKYEFIKQEISENVSITAFEDQDNGRQAMLMMMPEGAAMNLDTEDAVCSQIEIGECGVLVIEKDGLITAVWERTDREMLCYLQVTLPKERVLQIVEELIAIE